METESLGERPERRLQHWTPNELANAVLRAFPVVGKRRHSGYEALEELRLRALHAPFPLEDGR